VIDASDPDRFADVANQYAELRKEEHLQNKPLLIVCNKSDSQQFVCADTLSQHLDLEALSWKAPWKIIETSTTLKTKSILEDGIMFLLQAVDASYEAIDGKINQSHQQALSDRRDQITLQKQRVLAHRDKNGSPLSSHSSIMMAPGKMMQFVEYAKFKIYVSHFCTAS